MVCFSCQSITEIDDNFLVARTAGVDNFVTELSLYALTEFHPERCDTEQ